MRRVQPGFTDPATLQTLRLAVHALQGNATRAALLAGAADRLRDSYAGRQLPLDKRASGRYLAVAETLLGPEEWSRAWAEGRELRLDSAIDLALGL